MNAKWRVETNALATRLSPMRYGCDVMFNGNPTFGGTISAASPRFFNSSAPSRPKVVSFQAENWRPHLVSCSVSELQPHPSYARHGLSVHASKLSALADRGNLAFCDPIVISRDRIVIDGYARWELAKRTGRQTLDCLKYDLNSEEALGELIRTHRDSGGLPDFVRIELALDLEPSFQQQAFANQQAGGESKGLSKLTKAQRVNTRREVARIAGVSSGNVRKVKHILARASGPLLQAVRAREVSIHRADTWSHEPPARQQERLRLFRIEHGIRKKARDLLAAQLARISPSARDDHPIKLSDLVGLLNKLSAFATEQAIELGSIEVGVVDAPGRRIVVTQELIDFFAHRMGVQV